MKLKKRNFIHSIPLIFLLIAFTASFTFTSCDVLGELLGVELFSTEQTNPDDNDNTENPDDTNDPENQTDPENPDNPNPANPDPTTPASGSTKIQSFKGVRQVNFSTPSNTNGIQFKPTKSVVARANYSAIDEYTMALDIPTTSKIEDAAKLITKNLTKDNDKARAIYTWIATHIVYDSDATFDTEFGANDSYTSIGAFKNRKAVCQGYALLFKEMGNYVGLKVDYVSGTDKQQSYVIGDAKSLGSHGWNYVHSDDGDMLIDPTWGANKISNTEYNLDAWFDVDPAYMILSHYPAKGEFQNLSIKLSKDQFLQLPRIDPFFERLGIDGAELLEFLWSHTKAWAPRPYNSLAKLSYGMVKAVELPMTDILEPETYKFNFTAYSGDVYFRFDDGEAIPLNTNYDFSKTSIASESKLTLYHNFYGGLLFYFYSKTDKGSGNKRINIETFAPYAEEEDNSAYTKIGNSKVYYYDDTAELIDELKENDTLCEIDGWKVVHSGGYIYIDPIDMEYIAWCNYERVAYFSVENQWFMEIGPEFTGSPDIIKKVYKKFDDSIDITRIRPDYEHDMTVNIVPLSRKEEISDWIASFINYDYTQDEEFKAFVDWMRARNIPESTVQFYIDRAAYPSQRGFAESDVRLESMSYLGVDTYCAKTIDNCAGGMERYFLTRRSCDHTFWQQETLPVVFAHFIDTSGSTNKNFTPKKDVNALAEQLKTDFNSFMPNPMETYMVEIPVDYYKDFINPGNLKGMYTENGKKVQSYILESLKTSNPAIYQKLEGKEFAVIRWFDDKNYNSSYCIEGYDNMWYFFADIYHYQDLMHLQHDDLFMDDIHSRPNCLANNCYHTDAICPLCLYALGY